jgi:hypothetical protein
MSGGGGLQNFSATPTFLVLSVLTFYGCEAFGYQRPEESFTLLTKTSPGFRKCLELSGHEN